MTGISLRERIRFLSRSRFWLVPLRTPLEWLGLASLGLGVAGLVFVAMAPRLLGWHFVVVAGGSMEPTIQFGSVAVMQDVDPARVGVGDIVMYQDPRGGGKVVTHRIVKQSDDGRLTTRGDANNSEDEATLSPSAVRAEYLFSIPRLGRFVHWMGTSHGYMTLILVPGLLIVALELASIGRELRRASHVVR